MIQKSLTSSWISQDVQHGEKEDFWEYAWVGHQPLRSIQALDIIRSIWGEPKQRIIGSVSTNYLGSIAKIKWKHPLTLPTNVSTPN